MDRGFRILIMGILSIMAYLSILYILSQTPVVTTFNGSDGDTVTEVFTINKRYWDIKIVYFKYWSSFWSLKNEIYGEGEYEEPLFSTSVIKYTYPDGGERAEWGSHPSLPAGRYYLKISSKSVQWTIQIIEWD